MAKGDGKYKWKTGGRVHNISLKQHEDDLNVNRYLGGNPDLSAPPTGAQAVREANSAADLQYGPQVQAAQQLQANVQPWFRDYQARVAGYAQAAQALANPVLQQAAAYQQAAGQQQAPGLDPASVAGQQSAQAAQGRQALSQLGLDAENAQALATQNYFSGQQANAQAVLPQQQQQAAQALAAAQGQRGNAVQTFLTGARQNAQNYAIARGTLGLNTVKAQSDADQASAAETEKNRHNVASETAATDRTNAQTQAAADKQNAAAATPNKYGVPAGQWNTWSTSHRQRVMDAYNENHAKGTGDKDAAKHIADVHAATGKVQNTVTDIIGAWNSHTTDETDDTTKTVPDSQGRKPGSAGYKTTYAGRKLTPAEIKKVLGSDYSPQMIHIALLRRAGKKLDQASVDYLHNLDQNFRIPRDWLPGDNRRGVTQPLNRGSGKSDPSKTGAGDFK